MKAYELTTTSYALLGLLAMRSWTTYELAKQMQRTLHYFWPRAESLLYAEPKNLVRQGLAKTEKVFVGKRASTVYSITPEGRIALTNWLSSSSGPPILECEGIVRVFCADFGDKEGLLGTISAMRQAAETMQQQGAAIAKEYLEGHAPFQERAYLNALMFDFLWYYSEAIMEWAKKTQATVEEWANLSPEGKTEQALKIFKQALAERSLTE